MNAKYIKNKKIIIPLISLILLIGSIVGCKLTVDNIERAAGGNNLNSQVEVSDTMLNEDDNQNKDDIPAGNEVYTTATSTSEYTDETPENETPVENNDTVEEVIVRHSDDDIYIREDDESIVYLNNWGEFYKFDIKNKTYSYIDSDECIEEDINGNVVYRDPDGNIYKITPYSEFIWVDADGNEIWIRSTDGSEYRQLPVIDETETENTINYDFEAVDETVYAVGTPNYRTIPSLTDNEPLGTLKNSAAYHRVGVGTGEASNWSLIEIDDKRVWVSSTYLSKTKIVVTNNNNNSSSNDNYDDQPLEGQEQTVRDRGGAEGTGSEVETGTEGNAQFQT